MAGMTVSELIRDLEEVEDKDRPVFTLDNEGNLCSLSNIFVDYKGHLIIDWLEVR